jgi:hypothetical protein
MARKSLKPKESGMPLREAIRQSIKLGVEVNIKNEKGNIKVTGVNREAGESCSCVIVYGAYLSERLSMAIVKNFRHFYD